MEARDDAGRGGQPQRDAAVALVREGGATPRPLDLEQDLRRRAEHDDREAGEYDELEHLQRTAFGDLTKRLYAQ